MPFSGHIDNLIAGIGVLAAGVTSNHAAPRRPHYDGGEPPDDGGPPPEFEKPAMIKLWVKVVIGIALGGWSIALLVGVGFGHWFMVGQEDARKQSAENAAAIAAQVKVLADRVIGPGGLCERLATFEANQKTVMEDKKELWLHVNELEHKKP